MVTAERETSAGPERGAAPEGRGAARRQRQHFLVGATRRAAGLDAGDLAPRRGVDQIWRLASRAARGACAREKTRRDGPGDHRLRGTACMAVLGSLAVGPRSADGRGTRTPGTRAARLLGALAEAGRQPPIHDRASAAPERRAHRTAPTPAAVAAPATLVPRRGAAARLRRVAPARRRRRRRPRAHQGARLQQQVGGLSRPRAAADAAGCRLLQPVPPARSRVSLRAPLAR